jgi:hypothetical protein
MAKKKSKYDLIDEEILNYQTMNQTSYVPTDELFSIFESHLNIPNNEVLRTRFISQKISQYLGRKKDSQNRRVFLSTGEGKFSNVEVEKDTNTLEKIIDQLEKRKTGLEKNILKVKARQFLLESQLSVDDIASNE